MTPLTITRTARHWRTGEEYTTTHKASAAGVKQLLGLDPKGHFPAEGTAAQVIQGVQVYVTPARDDKRRKHRVFAICGCGRHIPVGRMFQHKCD